MYENPPGYEVEQPIDLSKPVSPDAAVSRQTEKPGSERNQPAQKDKQKSARRPQLKLSSVKAENTLPEAVSGMVVVANLQPQTFKSTVARMLHACLEPAHADVRLWDGVGDIDSRGLVIADMPGDLSGGDWRRQSGVAGQLVIPVPDDVQAARAAAWMLDRLEAEGRPKQVESAVVVAIQTGTHRILAREITKYFGQRTAEVVRVKVPGGVVQPEDQSRWEPLATAVLKALKPPVSSSPDRPDVLSSITPDQVAPPGTRRHGKAS